MVTTGLQVFALVWGAIAWSGMVTTCMSPEWRKNTISGTVLEEHQRLD